MNEKQKRQLEHELSQMRENLNETVAQVYTVLCCDVQVLDVVQCSNKSHQSVPLPWKSLGQLKKLGPRSKNWAQWAKNHFFRVGLDL